MYNLLDLLLPCPHQLQYLSNISLFIKIQMNEWKMLLYMHTDTSFLIHTPLYVSEVVPLTQRHTGGGHVCQWYATDFMVCGWKVYKLTDCARQSALSTLKITRWPHVRKLMLITMNCVINIQCLWFINLTAQFPR